MVSWANISKHYRSNRLPLAGVSHSKTLLCNETGVWQSFLSDRFGYSNPDSIWEKKKLRAVIVGDSFVLGNCLSQNQSFMGLLRSVQPDILNLGYVASSPLIGLARLKEYTAEFDVQHIVLTFFEGNDLLELRRESSVPILNRYLTQQNFQQDLRSKQATIDQTILHELEKSYIGYVKTNQQFLERIRGLNFTHLLFEKLKDAISVARMKLGSIVHRNIAVLRRRHIRRTPAQNLSTLSEFNWKLAFKKTLLAYRQYASEKRAKLTLVYLPASMGIVRPVFNEVAELATGIGFMVIDMHPKFRTLKQSPFYGLHYSPEANALIAEAIQQRFKQTQQRSSVYN